MPDKSKDLKIVLEEASLFIDQFLKEEKINQKCLVTTEQWLLSQLSKIRDMKINSGTSEKDKTPARKHRKDGMLVINTSGEIIRAPGVGNYFFDLTNRVERTKLSDILEEASWTDFKSLLQESMKKKSDGQVEIFLKTASNKSNRCSFEIDIASSDFEKNQITVYYSFPDLEDFPSFDFQSIVLDNLPGIDVFLFDREYRYLLVGGKEKSKTNLSNSDFIGKKLSEVYDKQVQRRFFPFYNKAINGEYTEGEVRQGKYIYYVAGAPVKNDNGDTIAGILISQNVTKDKLLEENLIKSKEQAQRANKSKSIFLANMSHEIRTPLNSIVGFAEQLSKTSLDSKQQKFVSLINNSSEHLLYLVNEIVFLFKLGMDKVYIEKTSFPIKELLQEIEDIYKKQAAEKKLEFVMETNTELPEVIKGDPFRLRQILMNLLVNALKYTDRGEIKLVTKVLKQSKKTVEIQFEVSDTGVGIDKKDLPFIFDMFEQGNKRTEKIRGGAGLGLGICKKLVTLFKGEIFVNSQLNKGSTFTVNIPFGLSSADQIKANEKEYDLEKNLLSGKKILLADDDDHNRLLAEMILRGWNTNFTLVKNGAEAITELEKERFDLALLDIHMPKKNGVDIIKKVRTKNNPNYFTPAVAITANALKADINSYLKAGFNDYVIKPFSEIELYNKLCNTLQIENKKPVNSLSMEESRKKTLPTDTFDIDELAKAANGDNQFFNTMIDNFTKNAEELRESFLYGMELKNWTDIGEKAHKAIPSFRFFNLKTIAEELANIENLALREKEFDKLPGAIQQITSQINDVVVQAKSARL